MTGAVLRAGAAAGSSRRGIPGPVPTSSTVRTLRDHHLTRPEGVRRVSPAHGVMLVLAAAIIWGTIGAANTLRPAGTHPLSVGAARVAGGGLLLVVWSLLNGSAQLVAQTVRSELRDWRGPPDLRVGSSTSSGSDGRDGLSSVSSIRQTRPPASDGVAGAWSAELRSMTERDQSTAPVVHRHPGQRPIPGTG